MTEKDIHTLWMNGKMQEVNHAIKKYLHEHHTRLTDLIMNKAHLIDGPEMPDCFVRFVTDAVVFGLYAVPTEDGQVPHELASNPRVQYPLDFDEHIIEITERLKARIEQLHKKYAQPLT